MKSNTLIKRYLNRIAKNMYGKSYCRLGNKKAFKVRKIAAKKLRV